MKNWQVASFGPFAQLDRHLYEHPARKIKVGGKVFLKQPLGLTGLEVSINKFPKGRAVPFLHKHERHEELYLCVSGEGEMVVDGERVPMVEGTAIRVAPAGARAIRNVGDEDFVYLCIQAAAGSMTDDETITDGRPAEGEPWAAPAR